MDIKASQNSVNSYNLTSISVGTDGFNMDIGVEMYVLEEEGRILAAAKINQKQEDSYAKGAWTRPAKDSEVMVLHTLVVDPGEAGRGIGTRFVAFYEDMAARSGCFALRMDTNARNAAARALYRKLGYAEVSIVPCVFNGIAGVNLVLLEKVLPL